MATQPTYEEALTHICRDMVHAMVAVDRRDRILHMNPAAERLRGIGSSVARGKPVRDVIVLVEAETRAVVELPVMQDFSANPKPRFFRHAILGTGNQREVMVDASFFPFHDSEGNIIGYAASLIDIRETMARERSSLDRQKIEAISGMAETMAQDFSEWLGIISGHASTAMDSLIPSTRAHDAASRIIEATEQAGALIQRLFAVATAARTDTTAEREAVNIGRVALDAARLAHATFLGRNVRCHVLKPEAMPYAMCNRSGLLTCLINLLRNAAEALDGSGSVTIDASERVVRETPYVVLRIRDTGSGITRASLRRIFEPFFTTREAAAAGTGLGLTVVKGLVESWGGMVKVRSQVGHGASFRLFLPRAATQPESPEAQPTSGGETVLVVDDDAETRSQLDSILRDAGFEVLTASTDEECFKLFKSPDRPVDATVVDMFMPGQDAKGLVDGILAHDPTAPLVIISGFSRDYARSRLQRGAWRFVQKPIDPETLVSAVRAVLDQRPGDGHAAGRDAS